MFVSESDRRKVHTRLVEITGESEADIIMEMFPKPELISQIADLRGELRTEVAGLRAEVADLRGELRTEVADLRGELRTEVAGLRADMQAGFAHADTRLAELRTEIHQASRAQTVWMIATMLALAGVIVAAFAAFH